MMEAMTVPVDDCTSRVSVSAGEGRCLQSQLSMTSDRESSMPTLSSDANSDPFHAEKKESTTLSNSEESASGHRAVPRAPMGVEIPPDTNIGTAPYRTDGISTHIDSALISAMRDPRERFALLRLEQTMVDFMKAESVEAIDVGGPYNGVVVGLGKPLGESLGRQTSFQRCWLHRLADRFCIAREPSSQLDGMIRCLKTVESEIPKRLLINLEPHEYLPDGEGGMNGLTNSLASAAIGVKHPRQRKMKIMKRNSSSNNSSGSLKEVGSDAGGPRGTAGLKGKKLSDKEKAYAEARARIFNEEEQEQKQTNQMQQVEVHTCLPTKPWVQPTQSNDISHTPSTPSPSTDVDDPKAFATSDESQRKGGGRLRNRPAAATMGGVSKVTWRNRQQEENDPDFQRGGGLHGGYGQPDVAYSQAYFQPYQQQYYPGTKHYPDQKAYYSQPQPYYHGGQARGRGRGYGGRHSNQSGGRFRQSNRQGSGGRGGEGRTNLNSLEDFPALR